jgi:pimeloyl-ACP methyl ester carboxylesterase
MERRDGAALAYDEAGHGDPPVILVHGWGVGRWAMRLVLPPAETASAIRGVLDGLRGDRYREVVAGYLRYVIGPRLDAQLGSRIVDGGVSQPRGAFADMLSDMLAYDGAAAVARVSCPILYVGTGEPYADLARFRALCPALVTQALAGCGHYFPLEAPEQLDPVLARFVETSVPRIR